MEALTVETLQNRRASIAAAIEEAAAQLNVLIGRRNECDFWIEWFNKEEPETEE